MWPKSILTQFQKHLTVFRCNIHSRLCLLFCLVLFFLLVKWWWNEVKCLSNAIHSHSPLLFRCSVMSNSVTPWSVACQAPLSMEFSRQEYWSGLPFSSPGDLLDPGIEPVSPALADSLPPEPPGKPLLTIKGGNHSRPWVDKGGGISAWSVKAWERRPLGCGLWISWFVSDSCTCVLSLRICWPWEGSSMSPHLPQQSTRGQNTENAEYKKIQRIQYGYEILWWYLCRQVRKASASVFQLLFVGSHANTLVTWCEELIHWKTPWCWERLRAGGEGVNRGENGWMASSTQWPWVLNKLWVLVKDREAWHAAFYGVAKT